MKDYRWHAAHLGSPATSHLVCDLCGACVCSQDREKHTRFHEDQTRFLTQLVGLLEQRKAARNESA